MKISKKRNSTRHIVRTDDGALIAVYGIVKDMRTFSLPLEGIPDDKWIVLREGVHGGEGTLCDSIEEARAEATAKRHGVRRRIAV